ncbi:hypothetical protein KXR53_33380 [Inquilinus limosus]|uniref:slr1658 superfamily regulator n=1 Tax=Inquilinus limosus TaxID=171674 RepID=UPI003F13EFC4
MSRELFGSADITVEEGDVFCCLELFDGPLQLSWHHCATTSDFISELCALRVRLPAPRIRDTRHSVSYLANELIENAVKFRTSGTVGIQAAMAGDNFSLKVKNTIEVESARRLQLLISEITEGEPSDLLIRRIEANAARPDSAESGLGLLTLMSDYGVRFAWAFEPADRGGQVGLETYARLSLQSSDTTDIGGHG